MFEKTLNIYLIFLSIKYKTKKKKKMKWEFYGFIPRQ